MLNLSLFKHVVIAAALLLPACFANAHQYKSGDLRNRSPLVPGTAAQCADRGRVFHHHNTGDTADRLFSVDTPIADKAELHEHVMQGDLMKMQPVPSVDVPPGGTVTFAPMAYHVMLFNLKDRSLLQDGKRFPLTLHFEKAGAVQVDVSVQKQAPEDSMEHMHAH
jgi:periplasmic copper chaperone A